MENKHISEALKEKKAAEGALKTSFFGNWKPDYDSAAHHYEKAGQFFKLGKSYSESKTCYLEAAKCYTCTRVLYSAGKCHEAASVCCKELEDFQGALHHIERAGDCYTQNGTASAALSCYSKGAEHIARHLPLEAGNLYIRAGELELDNDHPREAIKCFRGAQKTFAGGKLYSQCLEAVQLSRATYQQLENVEQVRKCNLSMVILHLARGDSVAAKQSIEGDVSCIADELISAVDSGDEDAIRTLATHGDVVYLDTEIAKIAKFLTQDGVESVPTTSNPLPKSKHTVTTTNTSMFRNSASKNTASLHTERDELFGKSNKEGRDELFSRKAEKKQLFSSHQRDDLFSGTTAPSTVLQPESGNMDILNPFDKEDTVQPDNNPFGIENSRSVNDDSNPFGADDETNAAGNDEGNPFGADHEANAAGNDESNPFVDSEDDLC